jgi:hypothetical protein
MRRVIRRRQPGQTIALAAVAMVAVVGGLAMVIDAGIFLVVQRQLQTAADAGALAGAWHPPVCPAGGTGCLPGDAELVAKSVAQVNADTVKQLCGGVIAKPKTKTGTPVDRLITPNVNWIVVTVECSAGYSFGRILGLDRKLITASAAAAIGDRMSNGDIGDFTARVGPIECPPDRCRIARLLH